jgi:hypothetical protein
MTLQTWEMLSYIVTVFGLPLAIFSFHQPQRKSARYFSDRKFLQDYYHLRIIQKGSPRTGNSVSVTQPRAVLGRFCVEL